MEKYAIFHYSTQRDTRPCVSIVSRCLDSQVVDVSRVGRNGVHKELGMIIKLHYYTTHVLFSHDCWNLYINCKVDTVCSQGSF